MSYSPRTHQRPHRDPVRALGAETLPNGFPSLHGRAGRGPRHEGERSDGVNSVVPTPPAGSHTTSRLKREVIPRSVMIAFMLFMGYMACPLLDLPFLQISLSAPLFLFIALSVIFKPNEFWFHRYANWMILPSLFGVGVFLSLFLNWVADPTRVDLGDFKNLLYLYYWLVVFVVTIYITTRLQLGERIVITFAFGILVTALLRWVEAIVWKRVGAWAGTQFFSENNYGIGFSMFAPCLLVFAVDSKIRIGKFAKKSNLWRYMGLIGTLLLWGAVVINGSRTSWIGVIAGGIVFCSLYFWSHPNRLKLVPPLALFVVVSVVAVMMAPSEVVDKTMSRFSTVDKLDRDKSFMVRQLMIQKAVKAFEQSPFVGIGYGRFRSTELELELPKLLRYYTNETANMRSSHNSYMELAAETGLVGIIPYALFLGILIYFGGRNTIFYLKNGIVWPLGIYAGFCSMSVHLWTLSGLRNTVTWVMYALVVVVIYTGEEAQRYRKQQQLLRGRSRQDIRPVGNQRSAPQ
jgi:O-antigen ligase